jgi:hypothetical protein
MILNIKNWKRRLKEVKETIRSRSGQVGVAGELIHDIDEKLESMSRSERRKLSNTLHLQKQGTKRQRDCWRAIALIEAVYFHHAIGCEELVQQQLESRTSSLDRLEKLLDMHILSPPQFAYRVRADYHVGSAAALAGALAGTGILEGICQNTVAQCIKLGSANLWQRSDVNNHDIERVFFGGQRARYLVHDIEAIPPDEVVVVYRRGERGGFTEYSHTMISIQLGGICVGSNNGCLCGPGNFSRMILPHYLEHVSGSLYRLARSRLQVDLRRYVYEGSGEPDYFPIEREFYARPISEIVRGG